MEPCPGNLSILTEQCGSNVRPNSYSEEKGDTIKSLAIVLSQSDIDERRTELPNWKILQGRLDGHPEPVRGLLLFHHLPCSGRPCHYCAAKHSNGWIRIDGRSPDEICRQSSAATCSFQNYLCTTDSQTPCYFLHLLLHSRVSVLQLSPGQDKDHLRSTLWCDLFPGPYLCVILSHVPHSILGIFGVF